MPPFDDVCLAGRIEVKGCTQEPGPMLGTWPGHPAD